jgi:DNA adenine methylase
LAIYNQRFGYTVKNRMYLPFLKWPGGKRWLAPRIVAKLNRISSGRYFEPFLGGGAVYFSLEPKRAVLSDINSELINVYLQVRNNYQQLIQKLKAIPVNKKTYLKIRSLESVEPIDRAVQLLYLNRTCFGGIYRINKKGKFNVPYGGGERTPNILWEKGILEKASKCLQSADIIASDFEESFSSLGKNDLIYCDPCYSTAGTKRFVRYNDKIFSWADQIRLAKACETAASKGAVVIVSNAFDDEILKLYNSANAEIVVRGSYLCPNPKKRGQFKELLLTYNCGDKY